MRTLEVEWKVPAKDGNTCYRAATGSSQLHDVFHKASDSLEGDVNVALRRTLLTSSDEENRCQLLIEGRTISKWIKSTKEHDSEWWETNGKPALKARDFTILLEDEFLPHLLESILGQTNE